MELPVFECKIIDVLKTSFVALVHFLKEAIVKPAPVYVL